MRLFHFTKPYQDVNREFYIAEDNIAGLVFLNGHYNLYLKQAVNGQNTYNEISNFSWVTELHGVKF